LRFNRTPHWASLIRLADAWQYVAGQNVGIKEIAEKIWLVSFMNYDLGFFDHETGRVECAPNPFGARLLPMCPERTQKGWCRLRDSNPRPTVYKTVALPLC
jgi:hypothetical protein